MTSRNEIIADRVRAARERAGHTRAELVVELEHTESPLKLQTIQKIENGQRPLRLAETYDLANVLGVDPMSLGDDDENGDVEIGRARGSVRALERRTQELASVIEAWTSANAEARADLREAKRANRSMAAHSQSSASAILADLITTLTANREKAQAEANAVITRAQKRISA